MAAAAMITMALGGLAGFAGNIIRGNAEKEAADINADMALDEAFQTELNYAESERAFRINARQELGTMRASYGASGISTSGGSAAEVLRSAKEFSERDAQTIKKEGQYKAGTFRKQADLYRKGGQAAQTSGYLSAVGSLFGTAGNIYSTFGGNKKLA